MTTRPYSECLAQALALCGVPDANVTEVARVKIFINRRAKKAYAESELWPRWLVVGEERIVSEDGLLPYSQDGLRDIGTIERIHESEPFISDPAGEYVDWNAQDNGVQITGYQPSEGSGIANMIVAGSLNPDVTGEFDVTSTFSFNGVEVYGYTSTSNVNHAMFPNLLGNSITWTLTDSFSGAEWTGDDGLNLAPTTPDLVTTWTPTFQSAGTPVVTKDTVYSAFITYKAAMPTTYGTGDGEEDEVPEEWFEWMASGGAASFLFSDKEPESALLLEAAAREDLDNQLAKVTRQNGAHLQTRVLSHGNMQARN